MKRNTILKSGKSGAKYLLSARISLASLCQALAVAEYLSFRQAALALGVTQSSVSARIKALEEDLGVLLFERNTRGVRLTESSLKNPRDPHKHWWLGVYRIPGTPSLLSNDGCFLGVLLPCSPAPPPMTSSVPALTR